MFCPHARAFAGDVIVADSANNRLKHLQGISSSPSYKTEVIAGSGNELRTAVVIPDSYPDAKAASLGNILGLTSDKRIERNETQDVYFTERVS